MFLSEATIAKEIRLLRFGERMFLKKLEAQFNLESAQSNNIMIMTLITCLKNDIGIEDDKGGFYIQNSYYRQWCDMFFSAIEMSHGSLYDEEKILSSYLVFLDKKCERKLRDTIFSEISDWYRDENRRDNLKCIDNAISYFFFDDLFCQFDLYNASRWVPFQMFLGKYMEVCSLMNDFSLANYKSKKMVYDGAIAEYIDMVVENIDKLEYEAAYTDLQLSKVIFLDSYQSYMNMENDFLKTFIYIYLLECRICSYIVHKEISALKGPDTQNRILTYIRRNLHFLPSCIADMLKSYDERFWIYLPKVLNIYYEAIDIKKNLLVEDCLELTYYTSFDTFNFMLPHNTDKGSINSVFAEANSLMANIDSTCLKWAFMNVAYMNDPNEGKALEDYVEWVNGCEKDKTRENVEIYSDIFLKSFSGKKDDLSMWAMYGDNAQGVSLVIDWNKTKEHNGGNVPPVFNVLYIEKKNGSFSIKSDINRHIPGLNKIEESLEKITNLFDGVDDYFRRFYLKALAPIKYLVKYGSYFHEEESRIIYDEGTLLDKIRYTGGKVPKVYYQAQFRLVIKEIVFGPKCTDSAERVAYLSKQYDEISLAYDLKKPSIRLSAIEYK